MTTEITWEMYRDLWEKQVRLELRVEQLEAASLPLGSRVPRTIPGSKPRKDLVPSPPDPDSTWIPILHSVTRLDKSFPPPCHLPGLYLTEPPRENQRARLEIMRIHVEGEPRWREPTPGDQPRCSSCSASIDPFSNADLDYLSHMQPVVSAPPSSKSRGRKRSKEEPTSPSLPKGRVAPHLPGAPPSIFPGHTQEASAENLDVLSRLSRELGLPEIPR